MRVRAGECLPAELMQELGLRDHECALGGTAGSTLRVTPPTVREQLACPQRGWRLIVKGLARHFELDSVITRKPAKAFK